MLGASLCLSVILPGAFTATPLRVPSEVGVARVYTIKDAIIAEFKLDAQPQQLHLYKLGDIGSTLLDSKHTLLEAGIRAGTKLKLTIWGQGACVACCLTDSLTFVATHVMFCAADPWALPEPQSFRLARVGDTDMYRTRVVKRDGRVWPFFLTQVEYQQLRDFVQEARSLDPKVIDSAHNDAVHTHAHTRCITAHGADRASEEWQD